MNSQFFSLNPYTSGKLDLQITQNLLQGFGSAVNGRNIRVQKNNLKVTDLQFKQQVITTVSAVLNLYWDLVSFMQDVRAREQGLQTRAAIAGRQQASRWRSVRWRRSKSRARNRSSTPAKQDLVIARDQSAAAGDRAEERIEPQREWPRRTWPTCISSRWIQIDVPANDEIHAGGGTGAGALNQARGDRAKPHQHRKQQDEPGRHQEFV